MDEARRVRIPQRGLLIAMAVVALALLAGLGADAAGAKGKKIHACVVKKGPDKGVMHFSKKGKCPKGEKKLSWGKKGKRGKQGPAGPAGPAGPQGAGVTQDLLNTIAAQQATIDQLSSQLNGVTTQLDTVIRQVNGVLPDVAALCSTMPTVVSQANALRTVVNGILLAGTIPAGLTLTVPATPPALATFGCP
jgi:hypothetical protein